MKFLLPKDGSWSLEAACGAPLEHCLVESLDVRNLKDKNRQREQVTGITLEVMSVK